MLGPSHLHALRVALLVAVLGCVLPGPALAQSTNYWSNQFGNRARLLGGSVVGSAEDLSAVYYNPGSLALLEDPQFLLAGNVYQLTSLSLQDGLGQGKDIGSSRLVGVAPLFAGRLRLGFLGKHRLAYTFLTRQSVDLLLEERTPLGGEDLFGIPDLRFATGEVRLEQSLGEYWAGLSWSYPLTEHIGIGVTPFVAVRRQKVRQQLLVQGLGEGGLAGTAFQAREFYFRHARLLAKLGAAADYGTWRFGMSLTTPGLISAMGKGHSGVDSTLVTQGSAPSQVVTDFQEGLSATYRSPWSVAGGVSRALGDNTRLHVSAEWFAPVSRYSILDASPFTAQSTGEELSTDVTLELDDVLNFGVGLEHRYSERLNLYLSFSTDFSAARPSSDVSTALSGWDLYHFASGGSFQVGRYDVTLGGIFAFGDLVTPRTLEFVPGDAISSRLEPPGSARVEYYRFTLVLGLSILRPKNTGPTASAPPRERPPPPATPSGPGGTASVPVAPDM